MDSMYRIGEALIGDGPELAHVDLLIGDKQGPVGQAFANGLSDSYEDRIARNQNALNEARTRANETQKTVNHGKDEEATLEDKNGFDKLKDGADVAKNKYNYIQ